MIRKEAPQTLRGSDRRASPRGHEKPEFAPARRRLPGTRTTLCRHRIDGVVRVKKVEYTFDTTGGPWFTEYQGVLTDGTTGAA